MINQTIRQLHSSNPAPLTVNKLSPPGRSRQIDCPDSLQSDRCIHQAGRREPLTLNTPLAGHHTNIRIFLQDSENGGENIDEFLSSPLILLLEVR